MNKIGSLEVITGCMFAGKTEELIREIRRARFAKKSVIVFDHSLDEGRYEQGKINTHNGDGEPTISVNSAREILTFLEGKEYDVVAIEEAQFFEALSLVCDVIASHGTRVIVVGLNQDFRGEPFEVMAELMARSDKVRLLTAICMVCGADATRTQRLIDGVPASYDSPRIEIGGQEKYQARCRRCHAVPGKPGYKK